MRPQRQSTIPIEYIAASDLALPDEQRTTFVLRPLTHGERLAWWDGKERVEFRPNADGSLTRVVVNRSFEVAARVVADHLVEVRNYEEAWPGEQASAEARLAFVATISEPQTFLMFTELLDRSAISETAKN
jgi:hypothetical protein